MGEQTDNVALKWIAVPGERMRLGLLLDRKTGDLVSGWWKNKSVTIQEMLTHSRLSKALELWVHAKTLKSRMWGDNV